MSSIDIEHTSDGRYGSKISEESAENRGHRASQDMESRHRLDLGQTEDESSKHSSVVVDNTSKRCLLFSSKSE